MPLLLRLAPWAAFLLSAAPFLPALRNGFVDWDDDSNFLQNPYFRGFSAANLRWMLTAVHNNHYHPLTWLSLALDHSLWGLAPAGYHLGSILLHAGTAAAFFFVARRLLAAALPGRAGGPGLAAAALLAALLFGVHPLRVESVAWASERRDVLSGLFYLLTVLFWLRSLDPGARGARWRELSLACYAASLLSKAIGVTLPAALLILDAYPLRRLDRAALKEKLPYLLLAAAAAALGLAAEAKSIALHDRDLLARVGVAAYGTVFYLVKSVLPVGLMHLYPIPDPLRGTDWPFPLCVLLAAAATAAAWALRRRAPWFSASWAFYLLTLSPVSGLVQFGPQLAADRYTYLSCLPWALLAAAPLSAAWRLPAARRRTLLAGAALAVLGLAALSVRQTLVWRDSGALWAHAAAVDPGHAAARNYLGNHAYLARRYEEAAAHYRAAAALRPRYAAAHNNLGNALLALGRREEAIGAYERAAELAPDNPAPRRAVSALRGTP